MPRKVITKEPKQVITKDTPVKDIVEYLSYAKEKLSPVSVERVVEDITAANEKGEEFRGEEAIVLIFDHLKRQDVSVSLTDLKKIFESVKEGLDSKIGVKRTRVLLTQLILSKLKTILMEIETLINRSSRLTNLKGLVKSDKQLSSLLSEFEQTKSTFEIYDEIDPELKKTITKIEAARIVLSDKDKFEKLTEKELNQFNKTLVTVGDPLSSISDRDIKRKREWLSQLKDDFEKRKLLIEYAITRIDAKDKVKAINEKIDEVNSNFTLVENELETQLKIITDKPPVSIQAAPSPLAPAPLSPALPSVSAPEPIVNESPQIIKEPTKESQENLASELQGVKPEQGMKPEILPSAPTPVTQPQAVPPVTLITPVAQPTPQPSLLIQSQSMRPAVFYKPIENLDMYKTLKKVLDSKFREKILDAGNKKDEISQEYHGIKINEEETKTTIIIPKPASENNKSVTERISRNWNDAQNQVEITIPKNASRKTLSIAREWNEGGFLPLVIAPGSSPKAILKFLKTATEAGWRINVDLFINESDNKLLSGDPFRMQYENLLQEVPSPNAPEPFGLKNRA